MKAWTQPICRTCYAAFLMGSGRPATQTPVALTDAAPAEPCMVCAEPTRIFVRVSPHLTAGLLNAREDDK